MAPRKSLLTADEVVEMMSAAGYEVSAETVRRWGRTGKVKVIRMPGGFKKARVRFRRTEFEAILRGEYVPEAVA
jgi:predicted site-specific integrase-resolvase